MKIYNTEFQRLQAAMMEETRLEAKLTELMRQHEELVKKTDELKQIMQHEQEDVERLNSRNLTAFYYRVTGKLGEKRGDKENRHAGCGQDHGNRGKDHISEDEAEGA